MWASLGVLAVAVITIIVSAQQMFINEQDLGFLLWIMVPAAVAATAAAYVLSTPIARDARQLSSAAQRVADGDLTARTGIVRNDELGDAAVEFDRMVARLAAVERERTLMLSAISHDLRTPLAALRVAVEAVRDGVIEDDDASLRGMERQVSALAALVDDLQLHTRLASGTMPPTLARVDLTELVDEAIEIVRPLAEQRGVQMSLEIAHRVAVDGDASQLGRVFRNLLDNAIRHAPPESTVRAVVTVDPVCAIVRVHDDGPGFTADIRERAFEPFTRGDPSRNLATGTAGLGLAIARHIVDAHHGVIALVDGNLAEPGPGADGACVEVCLPLDGRPLPVGRPDPSSP